MIIWDTEDYEKEVPDDKKVASYCDIWISETWEIVISTSIESYSEKISYGLSFSEDSVTYFCQNYFHRLYFT